MVALVEPVQDGRKQPKEVQVYELLERPFNNPLSGDVKNDPIKHVRYVGSFPLYSGDGTPITLQQIVDEIFILNKNSTRP